MKIATTILTLLLCLATSAFAQTALAVVTPTELEKMMLSFSVTNTPMTNDTYFTISVSGTERRHLPKDYYATLRTEPEPDSIVSTNDSGARVHTRRAMANEKGSEVDPSSTATNQAGSVVYSFLVPNGKLPDAVFMFWMPRPSSSPVKEWCCRIDLKPFTQQ